LYIKNLKNPLLVAPVHPLSQCPPSQVDGLPEINRFLTHLATEKKVAASTQNPAWVLGFFCTKMDYRLLNEHTDLEVLDNKACISPGIAAELLRKCHFIIFYYGKSLELSEIFRDNKK